MKRLSRLWQKGKDFLGVEIPIMAGAMTWISDHRLVSTVCNHGAFGCMAGGNMPPELFAQEIDKIRDLTNKPFAVNLITIAPHYQAHLTIAAEKKVPFIIFAGSFPRSSEIKIAKESGAKVLAFASNESIATRMIASGVNALMLEGSEAGGHIGHVSLVILLQQVLFSIQDIPIFVAGGIATGKLMTHLLLMGAAGIQMGTRFVMTEECQVHTNFKEAFIKAKARDAVATPAVGSELNVVAVRAIRNKGLAEFADLQMELIQKNRRGEINKKDAQYEVENYWVGALRRAVQDGDVDYGSLMAGQSVGLVYKVQPMKEMFDELISDAEVELERIYEKLGCEKE
jgi:enoyl-[acyl-carrier protein] reductase II